MSFLQKLNKPAVAFLAVAAIAGGLRFWSLSQPTDRIFDEVYYPKDACLFAGYSMKECDVESSDEKYWVGERDEVGSWVHPPLG